METFQSPTFGEVSLDQAARQIIEYMKESTKHKYDIAVGTDSHNYQKSTYFVTAIIVHRKGAGGRFFWQKIRRKRENILRNRMYEEANLSLETAQKLMKIMKQKEHSRCNLEIHVDIGRKGKTKEFINEIVGMIKGVGYVVKIKPEAYGASTVADRYA